MKIFLLFFILLGCGRSQVAPHESMTKETSDKLLTPYFVSFLEKTDCFKTPPVYKSLSMVIKWDGMDVAGLCYMFEDGSAKIVIDGPTWISINDINKERLMYHELGHCYLGLDHVDQLNEPALMTPSIREAAFMDYVDNYSEIMRDLFFESSESCSFEFEGYE